MRSLVIVPCTRDEAFAFIRRHHRHHRPPVSGLWCLGARDSSGELRGVAVAGRPVARGLDDGLTCEVTRVATDGCPNACSALYGAARRVARAMGYRRLLTYTLACEPGTSLRAAGWRMAGRVRGRSWSCRARPRTDRHPLEEKVRWEAPMELPRCPACGLAVSPLPSPDPHDARCWWCQRGIPIQHARLTLPRVETYNEKPPEEDR